MGMERIVVPGSVRIPAGARIDVIGVDRINRAIEAIELA